MWNFRAPAPNNLCLQVTSRYPDGSHLLRGFGVVFRERNKIDWRGSEGSMHVRCHPVSIFNGGYVTKYCLNMGWYQSHKRDICEQTINDEIASRFRYVTHFHRNFLTCHSTIYLFPTGETDFPHHTVYRTWWTEVEIPELSDVVCNCFQNHWWNTTVDIYHENIASPVHELVQFFQFQCTQSCFTAFIQ